MENATIGYKGMSSVPSEYLCDDGDMKLAVDAEMRDGSYHATKVPKDSCFHVDGFYPKFYHEPSDGKKYLIGLRHDEEDKWVLAAYDKDGEKVEIENAPEAGEEGAFANFCAMGNFVNFTLDGMVSYSLYSEGAYKYIGNLPPMLDFHFSVVRRYEPDMGLHTKFDDGTVYRIPGPEYVNHNMVSVRAKNLWTSYKNGSSLRDWADRSELGNICDFQSDDEVKKKEDAIFGAWNSAKAYLLKKGYLTSAVLLRYAYRLYDGSIIMPSNPILMFPPDLRPVLFYKYWEKHNRLTESVDEDLTIYFEAYRIFAKLVDFDAKKFGSWATLIRSVDFFISPQINNIEGDVLDYYFLDGSERIEGTDYSRSAITSFKKRDYKKELENITSFHLVSSFDFNELSNRFIFRPAQYPCTSFNRILPDDLSNYIQNERLEESIYSNSNMYARTITSYNSRMIASSIGRRVCTEWNLNDLDFYYERSRPKDFALYGVTEEDRKINGEFLYDIAKPDTEYKNIVSKESDLSFILSDTVDAYDVILKVKDKGFSMYLSLGESHVSLPKYIFLTDTSVTGIIAASFQNDSKVFMSKSMDRGYMLNWVYNIGGEYKSTSEPTELISDAFIYYKNLVKETDVLNPFIFKDGNSCECGKESVMAVASMSAPTSQGQFGQYPLFAFCTDGIYAIGIGSDGTIQNCSPYSTDILAGEDALANVCRDIVFASKAGVMSIGEEGRSLLLPAIKEELYGYDNERQKTFVSKVLTDMGVPLPDTTNVYTYITSGVRMAYDYQHGRVILYNPNYGYSYVLDAQSKSWSIMTKQFKDNLNPVAECLMVAPDGQTLHDYSTDEVVEKHGAFLMTRPFKMEQANVMKTIYSIIQRGNLRSKDAVQQALYGSRDMVNWVPIWSSKDIYLRGFRGTGYKYFRMALFLPEMTQNDGLDGATISYMPRETDQQR